MMTPAKLLLVAVCGAYAEIDGVHHSQYDDVKLSKADFVKLAEKLDKDKDGVLHLDEVMKHHRFVKDMLAHTNADSHIDHRDVNDDNTLTFDEYFAKVASHLRVEELGMELSQVLPELDENSDGKIQHHEFFHLEEPKDGTNHKVTTNAEEGFANLDQNKDGVLTYEELAGDELQYETALFAAADKNNNGVLDHGEVMSIVHPETDKAVLDVVMREAMSKIDKDADGKATIFELFETKKPDTEERAMFKSLDTDGDAFVDIQELERLELGDHDVEHLVREAFALAGGETTISTDKFIAAGSMLNGHSAMPMFAHWHAHVEL